MAKVSNQSKELISNITSIMSDFIEKFDINADQAMELLAGCLNRNLVLNEIYDMAEFIVTGKVGGE